MSIEEIRFSDVRPFEAEGTHVGIVTCMHCGAAILIDPSDFGDPFERHREWHRHEVARIVTTINARIKRDARKAI